MSLSLDLASLRAKYLAGTLTPSKLVDALEQRLAVVADDAIWISRVSPPALRAAARGLEQRAARDGIAGMPLYGIPFAVKDNIDVAGMSTTAGCPAFAYQTRRDATVIARLKRAGALVIGKTNLDQFATGLAGVRSP